ncbi:MAG: hypothetical protein EOO61_07190 [Hymenobacter sp.]|nr:MAG: hypothetical protein EOO61_07190 [Hymenobacter sp.]
MVESRGRGSHRQLLKAFIDYVDQGGSAGDFPFPWTLPSNAFGGYYNNETTFKAGMIKFLHRETGPSSSLSADNTVRERGADPTVNLHYSVSAGSYPIASIDVGNDHFTNPTALSGTSTSATPANTDTNFQLVAYDQQGNGSSSQTTVAYYDRRFAVASSANLFGMSDAQVSLVFQPVQGELGKDRYLNASVTCNNQDLYVAYPLDFGQGKMVLNSFPDNSFAYKIFKYTNSKGYASDYLLYKSGNTLFGDYSIQVQ